VFYINLLKFKTVLLFIILVTWTYLHTSPLKNATYELFIFWSLSSNLPRLLSCQTQAMRTLHCVGNVTVTQLPSFLPAARTRPYSPATHLPTHLNHLNHPNHLTHLPPLTCLLIWPTIISRAAENCVRAYSLDDSTTSDTVVAAALFIWLMTGLCSLSVLFYFIFFFSAFQRLATDSCWYQKKRGERGWGICPGPLSRLTFLLPDEAQTFASIN